MHMSRLLALVLALLVWNAHGKAEENNEHFSIEVGEQQDIYPNHHHGFTAFPDEPICILSNRPLRFLMVGLKDTTVSTYLWEGTSLKDAKPIAKVLEPGPRGAFDADYAGISAVVRLPRERGIIGVYHAENKAGMPRSQPPLDAVDGATWSIGICFSQDDGRSFQKLGQAISEKPSRDPSQSFAGIGVASMCLDPSGDYLYAYYAGPAVPGICMARSPVAEGGKPGTWKKYYRGTFSEPGIGGKETPILAPPFLSYGSSDPSVQYVESLKGFVMMHTQCGPDFVAGDAQPLESIKSGLYTCYSSNGIDWTLPQRVVRGITVAPVGNSVINHPYFAVTATGPGWAEGYLIYTYSPSVGREPPHEYGHPVKRKIRIAVKEPRLQAEPSLPVPIPGGDVVTMVGSVISTPVNTRSPVTVEAWLAPYSLPKEGSVFIGSQTVDGKGLSVGLEDQVLVVQCGDKQWRSRATVQLGEWFHVAAVFGQQEVRLYKNGTNVLSGLPEGKPGSAPFFIGRQGALDEKLFSGMMRCVRISSGERYTKNFMPDHTFNEDQAALLIYDGTRLDGMRVVDLSGKENHGRWFVDDFVKKQRLGQIHSRYVPEPPPP
jgi:hypothetical protein